MATAISARFQEKLEDACSSNNSRLCVGLDPDLSLISVDEVVEFNRVLIDATADMACAYKPNLGIYESLGRESFDVLEATLRLIRDRCPGIPVIGDVKRADIGLCGDAYAKTMLDYGFDAVTLPPYMGSDSLNPFLKNEDLGVYILCKTSTPSSIELQNVRLESGKFLYEHVAELARDVWNSNDNVGLVVGATYPEEIQRVRAICPHMPFLIPGVGAQGGDIGKTVSSAMNSNGSGFVINVSRQILYSAKDSDGNLALDASAVQRMRNTALKLRDEINRQVSLPRESMPAALELSTN
jgi:orotidine-5'-phosphate decarboxylase